MPNVSNEFSQHLTQLVGNAAARVNNGGNIPRELQNARVSDSLLSRMGHSIKSFFSTVGEAICAVGTRIYASFVTPRPRVNTDNHNLLPVTKPATDAANSALSEKFRDMDNMPAVYKEALKGMLKDMQERYGSVVPRDLNALQRSNIKIGYNYFFEELEHLVCRCPEAVTPQRLGRMAKELLEPEVVKLAVGNALKSMAREFNLPEQDDVANKASAHFLEACKKADPPISPDSIINMKSAQDLVSKMKNEAKTALEKGCLESALDQETLPSEHKKAVETMIDGLRRDFGGNCLPKTFEEILYIRSDQGKWLHEILHDAISNSKECVSPQKFAEVAKEFLLPRIREHVLYEELGRKLAAAHGLELPAKLLVTLFEDMLEDSFATEISGVANRDDAVKLLGSHEQEIAPIFADIANNVSEMETKYLPKVSEEVRPLLKKYIRSVPLDASHKEKSEKMLKTIANDMASWKLSIPFGDESVNAFCAKMVDELGIFLGGNPDEDFVGDIFSTIFADANRSLWYINDNYLERPKPETLIADLKATVPNSADQRFLSQIVNQYTNSAIAQSLNREWRFSETDVQGEELRNGIAFNTRIMLGSTRQGNSAPDLKTIDGSYRITVSEDKKSAVIEILYPSAICTDDLNAIQLGSVNHTVRIHCNLSAGAPDGKPGVTKVEISQQIQIDNN